MKYLSIFGIAWLFSTLYACSSEKKSNEVEVQNLKQQVDELNKEKSTIVGEKEEIKKIAENNDLENKALKEETVIKSEQVKKFQSDLENQIKLDKQMLNEKNELEMQLKLKQVAIDAEHLELEKQLKLKEQTQKIQAELELQLKLIQIALNTQKTDLEKQLNLKIQELAESEQNIAIAQSTKDKLQLELTELVKKLEQTKQDVNVALKQNEELQASLAQKQFELTKSINILQELIDKRASIDEFIRSSFSPIRGLWVMEEGDGNGLAIDLRACTIFMRVDSAKVLLSRIIYCDNGNAQIDNYLFSEMLPQYDATSTRNSIKLKLNNLSSSCAIGQSHLPNSQSVLFLDNQAPNNIARIGTYAALMFGNKPAYLNSGSNVPSLLRNSNCEVIIKSAANYPELKLLQLAKKACELESQTTGVGCFTSANNFVPTH